MGDPRFFVICSLYKSDVIALLGFYRRKNNGNMKRSLSFILFIGFSLNICAQRVETEISERAADPNAVLAKTFTTTGIIDMAVGVPCIVAGISCLMYANLMEDPTKGYTTSKAVASQYSNRKYISPEDYVDKLANYYDKKNAANTAGYILTPMGGALTIIGVPLYLYGKKMMQVNINYTGNGAGVSATF